MTVKLFLSFPALGTFLPVVEGNKILIFVFLSLPSHYYYFYRLMQGIYSCIPETNHIFGLHIVAAVIYLQFMLHGMLFFHAKLRVLLH